MARIKLIVTGDMEKLALHKSLKRFFPSERDGQEVIWDTPRFIPGATSNRLQPLSSERGPSTSMLALAKAMLAEAFDGKTGKPADLVVVIDDVEIGNLEQEEVVAEHFRAAVKQAVDLRKHDARTEARIFNSLSEKCSFHLLKPMAESYLFGDAAALRIVGVPSGTNPLLVHPSDVEQFETNDPAYLPICRAKNTRQQQHEPWWHEERHPKNYLKYLAKDYEETLHGKQALIDIAWNNVPKQPTDIPIIRSLFEDISNWFDIPNPIPGLTDPAFYPNRKVDRATLLLRNL